ncbi:MAG: ABC transporter ATP-binding protein [Chloroflexi bacterium]|nr:MAG: ABC transporter ATP-binding protein [Chloroflexota bacterium]TMC71398.1 MAG: ABC transporter ATP-binding protein [Chloroflexota bacterium]
MLEIEDLTVRYGLLPALTNVSFTLAAGETVAMIGANGAGKSTLLRAIAGIHTPTAGSIRLEGRDITHLPAHRRVAAGIVLVPEGRRLFPSLTLEENLVIGSVPSRRGSWNVARVFELFPWMATRRARPVVYLSGGEQQAVAIGRALMANPTILLIDEMSLGLSPAVVRKLYDLLPELLAAGTTILLVEQDVTQALRVSDRAHCLLEGKITLSGRPRDLSPSDVEAAYFGLAKSTAGGRG